MGKQPGSRSRMVNVIPALVAQCLPGATFMAFDDHGKPMGTRCRDFSQVNSMFEATGRARGVRL